MKTPIVKKSTFKGILIGVAAFCLFSLAVFMTKAVDLSEFKIIIPARELTQAKWNSLIGGIESLFNDYETEIKKMEIPNGTVIIYAGAGGCPTGWKQWGDGLDGRFLMPLQTSDGTSVKYGGSKTFKIKKENLPKHSHKIISIGQGSAGIAPNTYLAAKNFGTSNIGYADYHLQGASGEPTLGLTSEEGGTSKEIRFTPEYVKILFCVKGNTNYTYQGGSDDGDDEGNNVGGNCEEVAIPKCGSKHKGTGEPTIPAEKCIESSPSGVTSNNGIYSWTCTTGGNSIDCYSFPSNTNIEPETKENGMCDFSTANCMEGGGEYQFVQRNPQGKVWLCKGKGGGDTHTCVMDWVCGKASCTRKNNTHCATMYPQNSQYNEGECKAAGAYWTTTTYGGIGNVGVCYLGTLNPSWPFYEYLKNSPSCSSYQNTESCLEWTTNTTIKCEVIDNNTKTTFEGSQAESACSAISSKKPSSCGGGGSSSTYTDYCTTVKNTCQNGASLSTTKSSFLPAGEYYGWYFYCVGSNGTEQTCRGCRSGCKMHGGACYKVNSAGQVTQDRCD